MRLTTLQKNETSVSALVERIYPNLTEASRRKAEAAVIKANPHLSGAEAFRPGAVVTLPTAPELKPRPGVAGNDPVDDMLSGLQVAVASYHDELVKRLDQAVADLGKQEEILKQKEVATAIKGNPAATELAKSLVESLRERKKIAAGEKKGYDATFAAISKDLGSLLG
jgi:hypothetical protein